MGGAAGLWFARIFTLPHTLIGIGAFGYWCLLLLWALFASEIPGVVTGSDVQSSRKGGNTYTLRYQFQVGDEIKSGSSSVSRATYDRIRAMDVAKPPVTVRYFGIDGFAHHQLREGRSGIWAGFGFLTIWMLFWNSMMGVFVYGIWIQPWRVRLLYKYGDVTGGLLVGKRSRSGKSTTYYVSYTFKHPLSGETVEGETQVRNRAAWEKAWEAQPVTVLYSFNKPRRSTVYEYGGYRVEGVAV